MSLHLVPDPQDAALRHLQPFLDRIHEIHLYNATKRAENQVQHLIDECKDEEARACFCTALAALQDGRDELR